MVLTARFCTSSGSEKSPSLFQSMNPYRKALVLVVTATVMSSELPASIREGMVTPSSSSPSTSLSSPSADALGCPSLSSSTPAPRKMEGMAGSPCLGPLLARLVWWSEGPEPEVASGRSPKSTRQPVSGMLLSTKSSPPATKVKEVK